MASPINPWDVPEWHFISRESALVCYLIGSGATALGRANYASQMGEYYTAFFGLSVGLERLAKLILVADHAIMNAGQMPVQNVVRQYGHKLAGLMTKAEEIAGKHALKLDYSRPAMPISQKIVECLDTFADAGRGRYANFAALGDPNFGQEEPIRKWWEEVAELILKNHYYGKMIQKRVESRAVIMDKLMSPTSRVLYIDENGSSIQDMCTASIRSGQNKILNKYSRYYALTVVRWLSDVFSALSKLACHTHNISAFCGAWEHFRSYTVSNFFLKTRKKWPLT